MIAAMLVSAIIYTTNVLGPASGPKDVQVLTVLQLKYHPIILRDFFYSQEILTAQSVSITANFADTFDTFDAGIPRLMWMFTSRVEPERGM